MEGDSYNELYGIEEDFEERFADELEALAELEGQATSVLPRKVSEFRSRKRTFEEALSSGDLLNGSTTLGCRPCLGKHPQGHVLAEEAGDHEGPHGEGAECLRAESAEDPGCLRKGGADQTPKPKRQRCLEAVKKLDFGKSFEDLLQDGGALPLSLGMPLELQDVRNPKLEVPASTEEADVSPVHLVPPEETGSKKVLKRPPILADYINVTSTSGNRVFLVVKNAWMERQLFNSPQCSRSGALHLLGVPFSCLKEQVAEERRRQMLQSSEHLTESLDSSPKEENQTEATVPGLKEDSCGQAEEDESAQHSLWVDQFTPRHYVELLSDDYTNRCLLKWLKLWDKVVFGKEPPSRKAKLSSEAHPSSRHPKAQQSKWKTKAQLVEEVLEAELDQHNRPKYRVALLCGPPGLGKTTLAHVVVKRAGYNAVEINASDDRSPEIFRTRIEAATQMKSVLGASEKPNCLVIDEIDGAPEVSINVLLSIINWKPGEAELGTGGTKAAGTRRRKEGGLLLRPIICICNDQYVPSLRLLRQQAFLLNFPSTSPPRLVQRLHEIAVRQGMKANAGALMALCEKAENDIRSCINTLQFLHGQGKKELTVRTVQAAQVGLKDQNKGLFSIWQEIFQLPRMQRQRIGMDPSTPACLLARGDTSGAQAGRSLLKAATQRFYHILHLGVSSGEHEKLAQGLYDNFLNMKMRDSSFGSVCLALEWLAFADLLNRAVLHGQNFQLLRYLPFLLACFHVLFAAPSVPRLSYPNSQHEALKKLTQMQNLVASMVSGVAPASRSRTSPQPLVLDVLCLLLEIISPKLRPVNTQLYSQKEKQQLANLIATMLAYNLTYHQQRTPDGQYIYTLDPNMEEVCRFPDLPARKPLTYQAKQLIAREIETEKMRRTEAVLQTRGAGQAAEVGSVQKDGDLKRSAEAALPKTTLRNHEQRLGQIVKGATFEEKPETDFFGRVLHKKKVSPSEANQACEKNRIEKQTGKAVGQSDVWFRFNEGVSNAVRRNIYIKDLF
ncbi:chromosome transmission fidelity protein 18 homolog isoform X1 [Varanus komodoensis]|uniref:chromosome transmission fidelity protein 18 homolog isoform X1 n=1 Tax=Varanus komodoensis TaxID=61221 RepID=UPI001CF77992|nr:chromosome transmission fidelity protein 18 homolog isoform X1 [Varanus komodoensis]